MTGGGYAHKPLSGGNITPLFKVKFCDEQGKELPPGEHGEIWLRSATVAKEYWNKPQATAESFKDGWFVTGDVGYLDDEGYLFLTDRIKDMVIRGGENIYSAEIEATILKRDDVREVAAFGLPHETLGEELAVAICPKPATNLTAEVIQQHVASELAGFKVPSYVFIRDKEMPKNATLKILKKQLREEYMTTLKPDS